MMKDNNPLSPHIQIYNWHISSLVSISHRITGVLNIIILTIICLWIASLLLGKNNYVLIQSFLDSFLGKFIIIGTVWSFSFQILSEIRHLFWDMGYGFDLKISKITGLLVIIGSFVLTILIYVIVQNILNSFFGKFLVIGITWSFSFQILSEIRHLFWDLGYGFELKTSNISGAIVIFGSFIMTLLIYILGRQLI